MVRHTYAGREYRVMIGSPYGERYDRDWDEPAEIGVLRQHRLQRGARVFNLGANHGVIALMLAEAVGAEGQVVALEADAHDAELAKRNRDLNAVDQLECLHAAVAKASGSIAFGVDGHVDDDGDHQGSRAVPAWSIDDLADRYGAPDVVFMDVEGYEDQALAGARRTLDHGPDWFVEVHRTADLVRHAGSARGVLARFDPARYDLRVARDALVVAGDGRVVSRTTFRPLAEAPSDLFTARFFLLALSGRQDPSNG